jgi:hypothetical protein
MATQPRGRQAHRGLVTRQMLTELRALLDEAYVRQEGDGDTEGGPAGVLDAETADLLRMHHRAELRARMKAGPAWQDNDLIFCQADGRPWNPDHVSKRFKKLAAQEGVPVIKLHEGGRHTGNSLMRDAGVDQEVRMREVGHAGKDINDR